MALCAATSGAAGAIEFGPTGGRLVGRASGTPANDSSDDQEGHKRYRGKVSFQYRDRRDHGAF